MLCCGSWKKMQRELWGTHSSIVLAWKLLTLNKNSCSHFKLKKKTRNYIRGNNPSPDDLMNFFSWNFRKSRPIFWKEKSASRLLVWQLEIFTLVHLDFHHWFQLMRRRELSQKLFLKTDPNKAEVNIKAITKVTNFTSKRPLSW